jgi:hypothetical protein
MEESRKGKITAVVVTGIITLIVGGIIGAVLSPDTGGVPSDALLEKLRVEHKMAEIVKNKQVYDLEEALSQAEVDIGAASDMIYKLRDEKGKIKYITVVKTVIKPSETKTVYMKINNLPDEKLFSLKTPDGDLVIARMQSQDADSDGKKDTIAFDQWSQQFVLTGTISPKKSAFLLTATSDYDGVPHDIPITAQVTHVEESESDTKVVQPALSMHIGGWAGASVITGSPAAGYEAGVGVPWLHPAKSLDVLTPVVGVGSAIYPGNIADSVFYTAASTSQSSIKSFWTARLGFDILSYNLGDEQSKILRDTWLDASAKIGSDGSLAGGISLSTRL